LQAEADWLEKLLETIRDRIQDLKTNKT
jgi:hypothetical protein